MRKPTWKGLLLTATMLSPIVALAGIVGVVAYVVIKIKSC